MNRHTIPFALAFALPALSQAQPKIRIAAQPTCAECSVETNRLFTVGPIPGATVGRDSHVARDSSGRYLVVVEPGPKVAVVDSMGRFIEFMPFKSVRKDSSARGAVVRVDPNGKPSLFDGESWLTDHEIYGRPQRVGPLDNFQVVSQVHVMGLPIAVTRPAPTLHRTFATMKVRMDPFDLGERGLLPDAYPQPAREREQFEIDSVVSNPACRDCYDLVLDVAHGFAKGAVWSATVDRYRVNIYQSHGNLLLLALEITDAWLPLREKSEYKAGRTLPEAPRMTGLMFDQQKCTHRSDGTPFPNPRSRIPCERRLWIAGLVFADSLARDEQQRYSTMVDVLGVTGEYVPRVGTPLDSARMITRTKIPGRVELFGPGLAYQHRALGNGQWALDVLRLSVVER